MASGMSSQSTPETSRWAQSLPVMLASMSGLWAKLKSNQGRASWNQPIVCEPHSNCPGRTYE